MGKPIIFLDFDGVLNNDRFFEATRIRPGSDKALDPKCIGRLNALLSISGANVVISSSWRFNGRLSDLMGRTVHRSLPELRKILVRRGFSYPERVVGKTPVHGLRGHRGTEISQYIFDKGVESPFVIIDDDDDMDPFIAHLVQTYPLYGMTNKDVDRAMILLKAQRKRRAA